MRYKISVFKIATPEGPARESHPTDIIQISEERSRNSLMNGSLIFIKIKGGKLQLENLPCKSSPNFSYFVSGSY